MNCWRIANLIAPFLDGELPGAEEGAVADHLEACARCAAMIERVAALPDIRPPQLDPDATGELLECFDSTLRERIAASESMMAFQADAEPDHLEESSAWGGRPPVPGPGSSRALTWITAVALGFLVALTGWSWVTQQRIEQLELSLAERDDLIRRLEQEVVASRLDPNDFPVTAGSDSSPVFLQPGAPSGSALTASPFLVPASYGLASVEKPRILH